MPEAALRSPRATVLQGLDVTDHRMDLAGIRTAVLMAGDGPPMVWLHGPGESSLWFTRALPLAAKTNRVIVPDLPGHGASHRGRLDVVSLATWLDALITRTCDRPPVLVGHATGGAIALHYAARRADLKRIVLVDSLGLAPFAPTPEFGDRLQRFLAAPSPTNYAPFFDVCMADGDRVRRAFGRRWDAFVDAYLQGLAGGTAAAMQETLATYGPPVPEAVKDALTCEVRLIWGDKDQATPVQVAEEAARRHGWALSVIDDCGDDPKLEQPEAFVAALL